MELSATAKGLPPLPTKPVPLKEILTDKTESSELSQFKPIEETADSASARSYANSDADKADTVKDRIDDKLSTVEFLKDRIKFSEQKSVVTSEKMMEQYQASEPGSKNRANHQLDQVV